MKLCHMVNTINLVIAVKTKRKNKPKYIYKRGSRQDEENTFSQRLRISREKSREWKCFSIRKEVHHYPLCNWLTFRTKTKLN